MTRGLMAVVICAACAGAPRSEIDEPARPSMTAPQGAEVSPAPHASAEAPSCALCELNRDCDDGHPEACLEGGTATNAPARPQVSQELLAALRACDRLDPASEPFGRCVCQTVCRVHAPLPPPQRGTMRVRYPFVDVDGFAFVERSDGRVTECDYDLMGRVDVHVDCSP